MGCGATPITSGRAQATFHNSKQSFNYTVTLLSNGCMHFGAPTFSGSAPSDWVASSFAVVSSRAPFVFNATWFSSLYAMNVGLPNAPFAVDGLANFATLRPTINVQSALAYSAATAGPELLAEIFSMSDQGEVPWHYKYTGTLLLTNINYPNGARNVKPLKEE